MIVLLYKNKSVGGFGMENLLRVVPVFGVLALLFAVYLAAKVKRQSAGT